MYNVQCHPLSKDVHCISFERGWHQISSSDDNDTGKEKVFTKLFRHCSPFPHLNPCSLKVIGIPSQNHITWQHDALTKFVNYSLGRWCKGLYFTYYRAPFDQSQRKDDDDVSIPDRTSRKRQIYKRVGTLAWIISNLYPVQCNALQYYTGAHADSNKAAWPQIFNQSQYSTCWSFPIGGQISSTKYHFSQNVTEMNFTLRKPATQIISLNTFKMVV